jgi:hypothetical protein
LRVLISQTLIFFTEDAAAVAVAVIPTVTATATATATVVAMVVVEVATVAVVVTGWLLSELTSRTRTLVYS